MEKSVYTGESAINILKALNLFPEMIYIPDFWISFRKITIGQFNAYAKMMGKKEIYGDRNDVAFVDLKSAIGYCTFLGGRMPSTLELVLAGGTEALYSFNSPLNNGFYFVLTSKNMEEI